MNLTKLLPALFIFLLPAYYAQNGAKLRLDEAVKLYETALDNNSGDPSKITLDYMNKWTANDFISDDDRLDFLIYCEKKIKERKGYFYPEVCFQVGKALQIDGDYHEAYAYLYRTSMLLKSGITKDAQFLADFHEIMGLEYYYFRRMRQAREHFVEALNLKPDNVRSHININNTLGLIYKELDQNDSSKVFFERALKIAQKNGRTDWEGVISGNLGYYYWIKKNYVKSRKLAETDFNISLNTRQWGSALNALSLLIDIDLVENKLDAATEKVKRAYELLNHDESMSGRRVFYKAKTALLEKKGEYREALESHKKSIAYKDSMVMEVNLENFNNTEFQINFEKKQAEISLLQEKKKQGEFVIISLFVFLGTLVVAFIIILVQVINKRKKDKQILILQNLRTEEELKNTEREMRSILNNLIEKNQLVDQLKEEVELFHANQDDEKSVLEREKLFDKLQSFTLLTEDDWLEFKKLFEKLNPGFFDHLTDSYPELTNAEIRLATLIKLNLSNLEMARTLGISPDSVRKTNLRLRKKLEIEHQDELIAFIKSIRNK